MENNHDEKLNKDMQNEDLLSDIGKMMDEKLSNHPTKADLDEKLGVIKKDLMNMLAEFTDEVLLPGITKRVKEIISEELENYPTKLDLERSREEIITEIREEIRKKIEPMKQHQTIVTGVIGKQKCANPAELNILKEAVS